MEALELPSGATTRLDACLLLCGASGYGIRVSEIDVCEPCAASRLGLSPVNGRSDPGGQGSLVITTMYL